MGYGKTNTSPIQIDVDVPELDQLNQTVQTNTSNITTLTQNVNSNTAQLADMATNLQGIFINIMHPPTPLVACKGDGTTDDRPALQAIINYVKTLGGGTVWIPYGTFLLKSFTVSNQFLQLKSNVSIMGVGTLKIADNFGDYVSVFSPSENLSNVTLSGFTINENTTNNPVTTNLSTTNMYRSAIYLWGGYTHSHIRIEDITFQDCLGIWQITSPRVTDFKVKNNRIIYSTFTPPIYYDKTSIYFGCVGGEITGNHLIGSPQAHTAIEIHGSHVSCHDNLIESYDNGMYIVNDNNIITGTGEVFEGVNVHDNIFLNVGNGIQPWFQLTTQVNNLKIHNNTINISPTRQGKNTTLTGHGISFYPVWGITSMSNVEITNNMIRYNIESGTSDASLWYGIYLSLSNLSTQNNFNFDTVIIRENTVVNSINSGIRVELGNGASTAILKGLSITKNTVKNPGQLVQAHGVALVGVPNYLGCKVERNTVADDRTTSNIQYAFYYASANPSDGALQNLKFVDNEIFIKDTSVNTFTQMYNFQQPCYVRAVVNGCAANSTLTINAKSGSRIDDTATGRIFTQVTAPSGTKWISQSYGTDTPYNLNDGQFYQIGDTVTSVNAHVAGQAFHWYCSQTGVACKAQWAATTAYIVGQKVRTASGNVYQCTVAGTSGSSAPTATSGTITDGTVTWKFLGYLGLFIVADTFAN